MAIVYNKTSGLKLHDNTGATVLDADEIYGQAVDLTTAGDGTPLVSPITGSVSVGDVTVEPVRSAIAQENKTITTGGTAQVALATKANRNYFEIINISNEVLYLGIGVTATTDGIPLDSNGGGYFSDNMNITTSAISILGATTGSKFITIEY
jgi:hypothetical protein